MFLRHAASFRVSARTVFCCLFLLAVPAVPSSAARRSQKRAAVEALLQRATMKTNLDRPGVPQVPGNMETGDDGVVVFMRRKNQSCPSSEGDIPRVLQVVPEKCGEEEFKKLSGNMPSTAKGLECFEMLCYPATVREVYVKKYFPDWFELYDNMSQPVMKADMFKVLILYDKGGFYIDDDVILFPQFFDRFEEHKTDNIIVGWERRTDSDKFGIYDDGSRMLTNSLALWAMGSQPRQNVWHAVIEDVKAGINALKAKSSNVTKDVELVLRGTGPVRVTTTFVDPKNKMNPNKFLPVAALACNAYMAPSCDSTDPQQWLRHTFAGSWKHRHAEPSSMLELAVLRSIASGAIMRGELQT